MSGVLAVFERADDDAIEAWAASLPADEVVFALHLVTQLARGLRVGEKMLKSRVAAETLLSQGESWTAPDGREYVWAGDRERVVSDPVALRMALEALGLGVIAERELHQSFKEQPPKVYLTHLDAVAKFGGDEVEKVIRSFVQWKETAPKLREIGEDGK